MKLKWKDVMECTAAWLLGGLFAILIGGFIFYVFWTLWQPFWFVGSHIIAFSLGTFCMCFKHD